MIAQQLATNGRVLLDDVALVAFRERMRGEVIVPGDARYDAARRVWNGLIDKRPAAIARRTGVADVVAAVTFAREQGLPVAIRGGHNVAGTAVNDGRRSGDRPLVDEGNPGRSGGADGPRRAGGDLGPA